MIDRDMIKTTTNYQKRTQTAGLFHKNPVLDSLNHSGSKSMLKKNTKTTEVITRKKKINLE